MICCVDLSNNRWISSLGVEQNEKQPYAVNLLLSFCVLIAYNFSIFVVFLPRAFLYITFVVFPIQFLSCFCVHAGRYMYRQMFCTDRCSALGIFAYQHIIAQTYIYLGSKAFFGSKKPSKLSTVHHAGPIKGE